MAVAEEKLIIPNPIKITFDPRTVIEENPEGGIPIGKVFEDPIARIYWLTFKTFYLTNTDFRKATLEAAARTRHYMGKTERSLPVAGLPGKTERIPGLPFWVEADWDSWAYRRAIFPFVVQALLDEGLCKYPIPPGICRLQYTVDLDSASYIGRCCVCGEQFWYPVADPNPRSCHAQECSMVLWRWRQRLAVTGGRRVVTFEDRF